MVQAANGEDPQVRGAAMTALGVFPVPRRTAAIVQGLRDSVPAVLLAAVKASVARRSGRRSPSSGFRARNDPDRKVKDEAIKALAGMGGGEPGVPARNCSGIESGRTVPGRGLLRPPGTGRGRIPDRPGEGPGGGCRSGDPLPAQGLPAGPGPGDRQGAPAPWCRPTC
ncbi:MAG: HEAT repeat domain-containing protein [Bacillus subtilis]|nr:HEAT repeat domain-containing protein [Bacillus subtilis]